VIDAMKNSNPVIYVIDPDQGFRSELMQLFTRIGVNAAGYSSAEEFLAAKPDLSGPGCVVAEMKLPGASGLELQTELRHRSSRLPLIILTSDPDVGRAVNALHNNVSDYLVKPVVERELIRRIRVALRGTAGEPE